MARGIERLRRLWRDTAGAAVLEFALVLPPLLALTVGAIDGGRAMLALNSVEKLAKDGARFASVRGSASPTPATEASIASYLDTKATGLNTSDLTVTVTWNPDNDPGSAVTVNVVYAFTPSFLPIQPIDFDRSSIMTIMR